MTRQLRPSQHCLNCGGAVATRFCAECGQENTDYRVSLGRLLADLFEELFQLESRLWRTLWTLVRRPGLLTIEYNAGRRVSYTTPLRLYLIASVTYFFVGTFTPHQVKANVRFPIDEMSAQDKAELEKVPLLHRYVGRIKEALAEPKVTMQRIEQTVRDDAPRVAAVLVPLFALLTWLSFRKRKLFFVEHLVFALHAHATAFAFLTLADVGHLPIVGAAAATGIAVTLFLAARRVFGQSALHTTWKLALIAVVYFTFLGVALLGVVLLGFLSRG